MAKRHPPLSEEDRALFRAAMADVTPVRSQTDKPPPAVRQAQGERRISGRAEPVPARTQIPTADPRAFRKLARGRIRAEATLDLHGHTLAQAHAALHRFIARVQARGARAVIVVTGKGAKDAPTLRAEVPRWLSEPGLRGAILGFSEAQPRHGGAGALYVLLRRAR